ncbi:MarR family transcriptional regulator [Calidifontibacter terrae]
MRTEQLASELRAASQRLVRRLAANTRADGLSPTQLGMLAQLDLQGELTGADLARREAISPQASNVATTDLLRRGLLGRRQDDSDRRRQLLSLTDEGRRLIHTVRDDKNTWLGRRLEADFTAEERRTLEQAVHLMHRLTGTP